MKTTFGAILILLAGAAHGVASDQRLSGRISDSLCRDAHKPKVEHEGAQLTDHDCTVACVKKGAKYVFVSQGKVYSIQNQDFAGLEESAGKTVTLTGEMLGDSIKISNFEPAAEQGKR